MGKNRKEEEMKQEEVVEEVVEEVTSHPEELEIDDQGVVSDEVAEQVFENTEIDHLKAELSAKEDQVLRVQAEMVNMRTRFQKERESAARYRSQDLAQSLLPALDNLERALATDVSEETSSLKKGVEMVLDGLHQALTDHGIEEIQALGEIFDPNFHQAVQTVEIQDGQKEDEIVEVLQKGYKLQDRILRPAMVVVAQ